MKRFIALLLLLSMCFTACTPTREDYALPIGTVDNSSLNKTDGENAAGATPTPLTDGEGLRVLVAERDLDEATTHTLFSSIESYRKRESLPAIALDFVEIKASSNTNAIPAMETIAAHYYDTIALKLLAGDDDFDMFLIGSQSYQHARGQVHDMLNKNYFVSMETLGLAALYDDMLPGVKGLCTADGAILLAPIRFVFTGRMMKRDALSRLNISAGDMPRTAKGFTDFILSLCGTMESTQTLLVDTFDPGIFIEWFAGQYVAEYMDYGENMQAMWDALVDALDRLFASGLLAFETGGSDGAGGVLPYDFPAMYHTDALMDSRTVSVTGNDSGEAIKEYYNTELMPYILLTEDAKEPIYGGAFLAVNPNTKHLDDVRAYLSTMLSADFRRSATTKDYWIIYDDSDFHENADYLWYKDALANSTRGYSSPYGAANGQYISYFDYLAYHNGTMTSAQWKAKVDRELEFLRDE